MVILLTKDYKDKQADTRLAALYKTRVALRQYKSTRVELDNTSLAIKLARPEPLKMSFSWRSTCRRCGHLRNHVAAAPTDDVQRPEK